VESLLDEPAAILVIISLAALLLVLEVALPTVGIAGTLATVLSVGAVVGLARQGATWWPLLGPAGALVLWCVMVAVRSRPVAGQAVAAGLYLGGSVGFGALADSWATVVTGVLGSAALAAAYPRLHTAAQHLLDLPTQVGMDSLVGVVVEVDSWKGSSGTVLHQGSRWSATAPAPLKKGDRATVVAFSGMTLEVAPPPDRND
jgi:membrane-bound ClpP family serine protease